MANAALFVGWGQSMSGREQKALQVFGEAMAYWTRLQQQGDIESFEPVVLEPHGGELLGFCLLRGDRDRLNRVRFSEEFLRLNNRAGMVVSHIGIVSAFIGEDLNRMVADLQTQASDLA